MAVRGVMELGLALGVCLSMLGLLEGGARWLERAHPPAHSYDVPRNPDFLRQWPAFTQPRSRSGPLVIVVTNSQGYFEESTNASLTWPAQLQLELRRTGFPSAIVANWSVSAAKAETFRMLMARASQHHPDLLLMVTTAENFSSTQAGLPLEKITSDVKDLIADPSMRALLRKATGSSLAPPPLRALAAMQLALVRQGLRWFEPRAGYWIPKPKAGPPGPKVPGRHVPSYLWTGQARTRFANALHLFQVGSPRSVLRVVNQPMCEARFLEAGKETLQAVHQEAQRYFVDHPDGGAWNAVDTLDCKYFINFSHLTPEGHHMLALWMLPRVQALLEH